MNKSTFAVIGGAILGALLVFVYYAFIAPFPPPGACPGSDRHCIEVKVILVDEKPQIAPIPDHDVRDQGVVITWMIGTSGYSFPDDGIVFNNTGEFINCHSAGATKFVCTDKRQALGKFKYTVKVGASSGASPPALDPYIINN